MRTEGGDGIRRLLHPRSIAIAGISPQPTSPAVAILGNIERFGYSATIHLVSRNRTEVLGRPCVPTIDDLPEGIDLALLVLPQAAIVEAVHACARRSIGAIVIYASGFAEMNHAGRAAQDEIAAVARAHRIALLGPNCLGFVDYAGGLALRFSPMHPEPDSPPPKVAFISQSGGTPTVVRYGLAAKSIGVSYQISTGNEAVLGVEDFLDPMIEDDRNAVIALFCEQIRAPQRFLAAVARARAAGKPIVLLQPGSSEAARASALSHTGALVGDHTLIRTIAENAGVVVVDTIEELIDVVALLATFATVPSRGPAIVTESGAFKGIALDFCERIGFTVPPLSEACVTALERVVPDFVNVENPLDLTAQALVDRALFANAVDALANDTNTGTTVVSPIHGDPAAGLRKLRAVLPALAASRITRPAILAFLAYDARVDDEVEREAAQAGVPLFRSPERALRALARVTRYGAVCERGAPPARALPAPLALDGAGTVPEYRAKELLGAAGIVFPAGRFVTNARDAQRAANDIGFPVALKIQSAALAHKSDAGALALGLRDPEEVARAWIRIHAGVAAARPGIVIAGALVEKMAKPGIEFIAGARRDPQWGTTILAGLGGIWAEALHDTVVLPASADEPTIVAGLYRLRGAAVLRGTRGAPALDVASAARALTVLGALIDATSCIAEIELNPLRLYPDGAVALDALIVTT